MSNLRVAPRLREMISACAVSNNVSSSACQPTHDDSLGYQLMFTLFGGEYLHFKPSWSHTRSVNLRTVGEKERTGIVCPPYVYLQEHPSDVIQAVLRMTHWDETRSVQATSLIICVKQVERRWGGCSNVPHRTKGKGGSD